LLLGIGLGACATDDGGGGDTVCEQALQCGLDNCADEAEETLACDAARTACDDEYFVDTASCELMCNQQCEGTPDPLMCTVDCFPVCASVAQDDRDACYMQSGAGDGDCERTVVTCYLEHGCGSELDDSQRPATIEVWYLQRACMPDAASGQSCSAMLQGCDDAQTTGG
jgi:hypothetical protein